MRTGLSKPYRRLLSQFARMSAAIRDKRPRSDGSSDDSSKESERDDESPLCEALEEPVGSDPAPLLSRLRPKPAERVTNKKSGNNFLTKTKSLVRFFEKFDMVRPIISSLNESSRGSPLPSGKRDLPLELYLFVGLQSASGSYFVMDSLKCRCLCGSILLMKSKVLQTHLSSKGHQRSIASESLPAASKRPLERAMAGTDTMRYTNATIWAQSSGMTAELAARAINHDLFRKVATSFSVNARSSRTLRNYFSSVRE